MFEILEFEKACEELIEPNIEDGWEVFVESHGVTIYRFYIESSGLYQYKIYGVLDDVTPEVCAQVYMDIEYRKHWDSYVNELKEFTHGDKQGIYWQINFPFLMSNRDYVYNRELRDMDHKGNHVWVVMARSEKFDCEPERSGVIRVEDYLQSAALMTDGKQGTKAFMHYYDNPRGMIPTWIINWGAKTGVPGFLTQMQEACRGYPEFLRQKKSQ